MTTDTARAIAVGTVGVVCAVALIAVQFTAHDPTPSTTTVTTTVTTPVAPCHHEDCPPRPSLDHEGDTE